MFDHDSISAWLQQTFKAEHKQIDGHTTVATPPLSREGYKTPPPSYLGHKRKAQSAIKIDDNNEDSSGKRRRRNPGIESGRSIVTSSITDLTNSTRFSQPDPIVRPSSPKKDILNELRYAKPNINWTCLTVIQEEVPDVAKDLIRKLANGLSKRVIPVCFKSNLEKVDSIGTLYIDPCSYDNPSTTTAQESASLWGIVEKLRSKAQALHLNGGDENAWCDCVVKPLMQRGANEDGQGFFVVENIQTQAIDASLIPRTASNTPITEKADYAWFFSDTHEQIAPFYAQLKEFTLSHMNNVMSKRLAVFCGVEVKQPSADIQEGLTQLVIWLAAGLRKTWELMQRGGKQNAGTEANRGHLPLIGWTVHGHDWRFYLAWLNDPAASSIVVVNLPMLDVSTKTYLGVFTLLNLLRRVEEYGRSTYWPWLRDEVLDPLLQLSHEAS